jgi:AcrR family transcriptional regulator
MRSQRRSTDERRAELADAALQIIAKRGISELSTKAVADAVGLTTGAIFRHFASMDELLGAVAERVEAVLAASYPPGDLAPLARLVAFVEARSAAVAGRVGILPLMLSDQFALALPEVAARRLRAAIQETREFLVTTLAEAQAAHEVRRDVEPAPLAVIVMGTVQMLAMPSSHAPHGRREVLAPMVRETLVRLLEPVSPRRA